MRYDALIDGSLATTSAIFILVELLFFGFFYLMLVRWLKLDDLALKRIDYFWLAIATVGLLAAGAQSDRFLSKRHRVIYEGPRAELAYYMLRSTLESAPGLCGERVRTEFSPPEFDEIVREQKFLCQRFKEIATKMPSDLAGQFPPLEETGYESLVDDVKYSTEIGRLVVDQAAQYRLAQANYSKLLQYEDLTDREEFSILLGPFLIALAIALRLTKVTGELRNARLRKSAWPAVRSEPAEDAIIRPQLKPKNQRRRSFRAFRG